MSYFNEIYNDPELNARAKPEVIARSAIRN